MGAPMRRLVTTLLALLTALAPVMLTGPGARAQDEPTVSLTLVSQPPWNSPDSPIVDITVRATNVGVDPVDDLSVGITLWSAAPSRNALLEALADDPAVPTVVAGQTILRDGVIPSGGTRAFRVRLDLSQTGVSTTQSLVYPLRVDVRSAGAPVATLRTATVYVVKQPIAPLNLAWTFLLAEPIGFGPDGVFRSTDLEISLAPGGRLSGEIRALLALTRTSPETPTDIAVAPVLLTQLLRMRDGYTVIEDDTVRKVGAGGGGAVAAEQALKDLRAIAAAPRIALSALPFSMPSLPALQGGDLSSDVQVQLERGRTTVETLLGEHPDPSILRPPGSVLDEPTLDAIIGQGVELLLLDPDVAPPPPQPLGFAAPAVTAVDSRAGPVPAVVGEPGLQSRLLSPTLGADPALAAQSFIAELASIWLERPGEAGRTVAITFPEDLSLPGTFFVPLVTGITTAPWLTPRAASDLADAFPAETSTTLSTAPPLTFTRDYIEALKRSRRMLDAYRSMLVRESARPAELQTQLLLAEAGQFLLDEPDGRSFVAAARGTLEDVFGGVQPDVGEQVTLTSSKGAGIPVRITNGNDEPLRVAVRLVSQYLGSQPETMRVVEAGGTDTVTFSVDLKTTGRFPVDVEVVSPSGRVINAEAMIVRSTAYNRLALLIVIVAGVALVGYWSRRFLPSRTS